MTVAGASKAAPKRAKASGKAKSRTAAERSPDRIDIVREEGKTRAEMLAAVNMSATHRHAVTSRMWADSFFSDFGDDPSDLPECIGILGNRAALIRGGNVDVLTDTLVGQMAALDTLFSAMMTRAAKNIGQHPQAVDRYMNIALKAQANCRVTAETIAKIKRGGKQVVKVVHVHEGGQAVVADTVHTGGNAGGQTERSKQSHEQTADVVVAALPGPDPSRDGVPLPSFEGKEAVPAARGPSGRAEGE